MIVRTRLAIVALVLAGCQSAVPATTLTPGATVPAVTAPGATAAPGATTTPATDTPPAATPQPTKNPSDFKPIVLSGRGTKIVRYSIPNVPAIVVISAPNVTRNFIVESLDKSGDTVNLLVNEIGAYKGTVLLDAYDDEDSVALRVQATGPWKLTIKPLSDARVWDPSKRLTGKGDDVIFIYPPASDFAVATIKHSGRSNFAVWAYGDDADLLVNEIGKYEGEVVIGESVGVLAITADGSWSVTPQ